MHLDCPTFPPEMNGWALLTLILSGCPMNFGTQEMDRHLSGDVVQFTPMLIHIWRFHKHCISIR